MEGIETIGLLQEPLRRRLYEYVVAQDHEVSRNEAAAATGAQRTLVAFHLDKLADAGLLDTTSRRVSGRAGPGAGRPAKLYRRAAAEYQVSLPPRDYHLAAELLADAAEAARLDDELGAAARRRGRQLATGLTSLDGVVAALTAHGYEPYREGDTVRMRNCPFHTLAERHPGLVCGMNLALLEELVTGAPGCAAALDPRPGECCTVVQASINNLS